MIRRYRVARISRLRGAPVGVVPKARSFFTYAAAARYAEACNDRAPALVRFEVQR